MDTGVVGVGCSVAYAETGTAHRARLNSHLLVNDRTKCESGRIPKLLYLGQREKHMARANGPGLGRLGYALVAKPGGDVIQFVPEADDDHDIIWPEYQSIGGWDQERAAKDGYDPN